MRRGSGQRKGLVKKKYKCGARKANLVLSEPLLPRLLRVAGVQVLRGEGIVGSRIRIAVLLCRLEGVENADDGAEDKVYQDDVDRGCVRGCGRRRQHQERTGEVPHAFGQKTDSLSGVAAVVLPVSGEAT